MKLAILPLAMFIIALDIFGSLKGLGTSPACEPSCCLALARCLSSVRSLTRNSFFAANASEDRFPPFPINNCAHCRYCHSVNFTLGCASFALLPVISVMMYCLSTPVKTMTIEIGNRTQYFSWSSNNICGALAC